MISQRRSHKKSQESTPEGTIQVALALLQLQKSHEILRWTCDTCGMVHNGVKPMRCECCSSELLSQQNDGHWEMNSRW